MTDDDKYTMRHGLRLLAKGEEKDMENIFSIDYYSSAGGTEVPPRVIDMSAPEEATGYQIYVKKEQANAGTMNGTLKMNLKGIAKEYLQVTYFSNSLLKSLNSRFA